MAVVVGGETGRSFGLDYKFQFSVHNYKSVPIGEVVVSNPFNHSGERWQLELKKTSENATSGVVGIACQLQLVTANQQKQSRITRISIVDAEYRSSPAVAFYRNGDKHTFEVNMTPHYNVLKVEVEVLSYINSVPASNDLPAYEIESPKAEIATEVLSWIQSDDFGDTTIVANDGKKFRCHRDILARRSEVFGRMFNTPMKESRENQVDIDSFDGEIVSSLLLFIYTGQLNPLVTTPDRLYTAAHQYQLEGLKFLCEMLLATSLSAKTIVKTYRLARFYHLDQLLARCVDYLDSNKAELSTADLLAESMEIQEGNEGQMKQI